MIEWLRTPEVVIAVLALGGVLIGAIAWVINVNNNLNSLKETADKDRATFTDIAKEVREDIKKIFRQLPPAPVESGSPLRLNDFGKQISAKVDAEQWVDEVIPSLRSQVSGMEDFQVDEFCQQYVDTGLSDEWETRVARVAYEIGTSKSNVKIVMAIVLRDKLLGH